MNFAYLKTDLDLDATAANAANADTTAATVDIALVTGAGIHELFVGRTAEYRRFFMISSRVRVALHITIPCSTDVNAQITRTQKKSNMSSQIFPDTKSLP